MGKFKTIYEEKQLNEASELYKVLRKEYPNVSKKVGEISKLLKWDVEGAMSFCLHLLEDVNMHGVVKELEKIFDKELKKL